ncbi:glycosyltransferase [Nocardioides sp. DS6]|uniref:Glycosyltransferase n=1 Tax=Nocardioides eburneus TaxID=3231482 RepID=A0ABV3T355_9ACTN
MTSDESTGAEQPVHQVSVVIPVYGGEKHLMGVVDELATLTDPSPTPAGHLFRVAELILVHDCGPDDSASVLRRAAEKWPWVRPIWLSRNFGQHAATLAGMASTGGEWIVTLDEDGQHDPHDIGSLLDAALRDNASLVYAAPVNEAPHPAFRRVTSVGAKRVSKLLSGGTDTSPFHSFRLVLGEVGRSVAAYAGQGVYLDVALAWVASPPSTAPVTLRDEGDRVSGYNLRSLLSHFWRMVLTSGTRGLRVVSVLGVMSALVGFLLAAVLVVLRLVNGTDVQGWTSIIVVTLVCSGAILFALGIVAEYVGVAVGMAMGRPPYLIVSDPEAGPLGRRSPERG